MVSEVSLIGIDIFFKDKMSCFSDFPLVGCALYFLSSFLLVKVITKRLLSAWMITPLTVFIIISFFLTARVYFCSCWPSRSSDWKCLLGAVLLGAWHPTRRSDAQWQNNWWRRWLFQHIFQRNWCWETCTPCCFRWLRANCSW